jgi:hypothetical protein
MVGLMILLFILLALVISAFTGWLFMLLWNFVVPSTFNGPNISFYKAWAIWFVICWIADLFRTKVEK